MNRKDCTPAEVLRRNKQINSSMNLRTPEKNLNSRSRTPKNYGKIAVTPISKYRGIQDLEAHFEATKSRQKLDYSMDDEVRRIKNNI